MLESCHSKAHLESVATWLQIRATQLRSQARGYNLGQNKWNIWTTPPPLILMTAKWRIFAPLHLRLRFGGKEVNCSFLFYPRLGVATWLRSSAVTQLCGYAATQLRGFGPPSYVAMWLRGYAATWLYG